MSFRVFDIYKNHLYLFDLDGVPVKFPFCKNPYVPPVLDLKETIPQKQRMIRKQKKYMIQKKLEPSRHFFYSCFGLDFCILILIKIDNILKKDMIKGICSYVLEFDLITFIVYFQENIQVCLEFSRFNTCYADIQSVFEAALCNPELKIMFLVASGVQRGPFARIKYLGLEI